MSNQDISFILATLGVFGGLLAIYKIRKLEQKYGVINS
jgi:hypothetical protein